MESFQGALAALCLKIKDKSNFWLINPSAN